MKTQIIVTINDAGTQFQLNDAVPIPSGTPDHVVKVSADYAIQTEDQTVINDSTAASAITFTLPDANEVTNQIFNLVNANETIGGTVTISPAVKQSNATTVNSLAIKTRMTVQSDGTDYWQIA